MATGPVERDRAAPLWQQVEADLQRRIRAGEFGERFPSEVDIAGAYGVSRDTVRQALRRLRASGVLLASRGRPSRVAGAYDTGPPVGLLYSLLASIEATGLRLHATVRNVAPRADGVVARRLHLEESTPLIFIDRLWYAGGHPLALDRIWLTSEIGSPLLDADIGRRGLYAELAARAGVQVDSGEEQVFAVAPSEVQQRLLECPPGAGAFAIQRLGRAQAKPVEWRQTLVRGDRYPLSAQFSARDGYVLATLPGGSRGNSPAPAG